MLRKRALTTSQNTSLPTGPQETDPDPGPAPTGTPPAPESVPHRTGGRRPWFLPMVRRLHFYAGLLVGPFILVAALTGALYAAAPQIEKVVYHHQLTTESSGPSLPLDEQVSRAVAYVDAHDGIHDASRKVLSVRPAPVAGSTTRVQFLDPHAETESDSRAVFIDPVTGAVRGDLEVYGSSGALPFRTAVDKLHRGLLLGEPGRIYSETAASWM